MQILYMHVLNVYSEQYHQILFKYIISQIIIPIAAVYGLLLLIVKIAYSFNFCKLALDVNVLTDTVEKKILIRFYVFIFFTRILN